MEHQIVLMVDEDHEFSSIIETKLKGEGFDVRPAYAPEVGLKMVEELHPSLILLDINLPGMTGIDFLVELKKSVDLKTVKVAFLSAMINPWSDLAEINEVVRKLGAVAYIGKETDLDEVVARVREIIAMPAA